MMPFVAQNPRALRARTIAAVSEMSALADARPLASSRAAFEAGIGVALGSKRISVFAGESQAALPHGGCLVDWSLDGLGTPIGSDIATDIKSDIKSDTKRVTNGLERGSPAPREAERSSGQRP